MIDDGSSSTQQFGRMGKENRRVRVLPAQIRRREMFADITQAGGAQKGIGDCVKNDVGIAVAG